MNFRGCYFEFLNANIQKYYWLIGKHGIVTSHIVWLIFHGHIDIYFTNNSSLVNITLR